MEDDDGALLNPRQSTNALGAAQFLGAVLSLWTVSKFGRRTLLLIGQLGSAILLAALALTIIWDLDSLELILVCIYSFLFNATNCTAMQVYLVEISSDIAFGTSLVVMALVILVQTATALEMISLIV